MDGVRWSPILLGRRCAIGHRAPSIVNSVKTFGADLVKDPVHLTWTGNTELWII
jgi:hypothetical protein